MQEVHGGFLELLGGRAFKPRANINLKRTTFWWKWSSVSVLQNETLVSSCTWGSGLTGTPAQAWKTTSRTGLLFHLKSLNCLCGVMGASGAEWYRSHQFLMVIQSVASGQLCCLHRRGLKKNSLAANVALSKCVCSALGAARECDLIAHFCYWSGAQVKSTVCRSFDFIFLGLCSFCS